MLVHMFIAAAAAAAPPELPPIPDFLAGCWEERRKDGGWTEECWTSARDGLMIGSARDGKADTVAHWEWMRIEQSADGAIAFYASPRGARAVRFNATETAAGSITFDNPANDYPQRVRYKRTASGVDAEISLIDGTRPMRWSYRRPAAGQPTISSAVKK